MASSSGSSNTGMSAMLLRIRSAELKDANTSGMDSSCDGRRWAVDSTVVRTFAILVFMASSFPFCLALCERVRTPSPLGGRSVDDLDLDRWDFPGAGAELLLRGTIRSWLVLLDGGSIRSSSTCGGPAMTVAASPEGGLRSVLWLGVGVG